MLQPWRSSKAARGSSKQRQKPTQLDAYIDVIHTLPEPADHRISTALGNQSQGTVESRCQMGSP